MSSGHSYRAVGWNRQKRIYDTTLAGGVLLYLIVFLLTGIILRPNATIETLLIRALGTGAFFLLHVILSIGPLCRLNPRFLPLLYNRRHLGVWNCMDRRKKGLLTDPTRTDDGKSDLFHVHSLNGSAGAGACPS